MARIPSIRGVIRRRFLVNFRLDPDALRRELPSPFEPQLVNGYAIGGICLIRLERLRPTWVPSTMARCGLSSENAAHRFAVTWGDGQSGVYIPRRDTNSYMNCIAGGRLFPGVHHLADIDVTHDGAAFVVSMRSKDETVRLSLRAALADALPASSCFPSLEAASSFFESGALGYSDARRGGSFDGIALRTEAWKVRPMVVDEVHSSHFADRATFPEGSVEFDHALFMQDVEHEWHSAPDLIVQEPARAA